MGITVKRTESEPMPPGLYAATIESCEETEGKFGPQIKIKFLIEEEGFEGNALTGWASLTLSRKSKLFAWVRAAVFGGKDIPDSYKTFDSDHLIGRRVYLNVTTEKGSDGEDYNKIKDVLPYRAAKAAAQPPAKQPAAKTARPSEPPDWPGWPEPSEDGDPVDADLTDDDTPF